MENIHDITDGRNLRSAITRQKLLKASRKVFLDKGFKHTTVSQIIREANTGYGTAYAHFSGKDDLLIVLMEDVMQAFFTIAGRPFFPETVAEAKAIILEQVLSFLEIAKSEREIMKVFGEGMGMSDLVSKKWDEIRNQFINSITNDIKYSQQKGLAKKNIEAEIVARMWFYANEMYQWDIVHQRNKTSMHEIAETMASMYVAGLYLNAH